MIIMIVCSTALLIVGFAVLPFNRTNLIFITGIGSLGYLGAFLYYDAYLIRSKKS